MSKTLSKLMDQAKRVYFPQGPETEPLEEEKGVDVCGPGTIPRPRTLLPGEEIWASTSPLPLGTVVEFPPPLRPSLKELIPQFDRALVEKVIDSPLLELTTRDLSAALAQWALVVSSWTYLVPLARGATPPEIANACFASYQIIQSMNNIWDYAEEMEKALSEKAKEREHTEAKLRLAELKRARRLKRS